MSDRPRILLTNDDGIEAEGLRALAGVLAQLGEVVVVAPRGGMSGIGHAVTLRDPVEAERVEFEGASEAYAVRGTPADCAKLAIRSLFADDPPALCVSGLNAGPNVGVNVFYSGTVAAALEAVINGVPAVAVSQEFGDELPPRGAARLVEALLGEVLRRGLPPWHALNVNIPNVPASDIRGIKLTRQGVSGFDERYREVSSQGPPSTVGPTTNPACNGPGHYKPGLQRSGSAGPQDAFTAAAVGDAARNVRRFVLTGEMCLRERDGTTDAEALAEGYVSVTPMALDLTARGVRDESAGWGWLEGVRVRPEKQ